CVVFCEADEFFNLQPEFLNLVTCQQPPCLCKRNFILNGITLIENYQIPLYGLDGPFILPFELFGILVGLVVLQPGYLFAPSAPILPGPPHSDSASGSSCS